MTVSNSNFTLVSPSPRPRDDSLRQKYGIGRLEGHAFVGSASGHSSLHAKYGIGKDRTGTEGHSAAPANEVEFNHSNIFFLKFQTRRDLF